MSATILCEPNDLEEPFVDTLELTYIKTGSIKGTGQMFHLNGMMNCWHPFCRWVCDLDAKKAKSKGKCTVCTDTVNV